MELTYRGQTYTASTQTIAAVTTPTTITYRG